MASSSKPSTTACSHIRLYVEDLPSSANQRIRMHFSKRHAEDQRVRWAVKAAWMSAGRPKHQDRKAWVQFTVLLPGRADDEDNRLARFKPVQDELVAVGALADDSPDVCRSRIPKRDVPRGKARRAMIIEIWWVETWDESLTRDETLVTG